MSEYKSNNFFDLLDEEYLPIKPIYTKGDTWLKLFGYSNLLCVRATRMITNHTITKWTTHLFVISEPWVYPQKFRSDSEV